MIVLRSNGELSLETPAWPHLYLRYGLLPVVSASAGRPEHQPFPVFPTWALTPSAPGLPPAPPAVPCPRGGVPASQHPGAAQSGPLEALLLTLSVAVAQVGEGASPFHEWPLATWQLPLHAAPSGEG